MPELTPELVANLKLFGGLSVMGVFLFWEKITAVLSKIKIPSIGGTSAAGVDNDCIHEITCGLIDNRSKAKDEEGVMLLGAFGKHMYDFYLKEKEDTDE